MTCHTHPLEWSDSKYDNIKYLWGLTEKQESPRGDVKWYSPFRRKLDSFTKLSILLPDEAAIILLGIFTNELKTSFPRENLHTGASDSFICNCRKLEATQMTSRRWIHIQMVVHAVMGYYSGLKRKVLSRLRVGGDVEDLSGYYPVKEAKL